LEPSGSNPFFMSMTHYLLKRYTLEKKDQLPGSLARRSLPEREPGETPSLSVLYEDASVFIAATGQTSLYQEKTLLVVGDIRLYNRETLQRKLGESTLSATADHHLVALSYRKWGIKCLQKLVGDFSFTVFDRKQSIIFAARDHLGIKQLYYRQNRENTFSISSSLKEVLEGQLDSQVEIDRHVLLDYLLGLYPDLRKTLFSSVRQLPPGGYLILQDGQIQLHSYWQPRIAKRLKFSSNRNYRTSFLQLFQKVLLERWGEGKRNILLFSGGLDSTAILCGLRHLAKVDKQDIVLLSHLNSHTEQLSDGGDSTYMTAALNELGMKAIYTKEEKETVSPAMLYSYFEQNYRIPWSPLVAQMSALENLYREKSELQVFSGFAGDEIVSLDPEEKALFLLLSGRLPALLNFLQRKRKENGKSFMKNVLHEVIFRLFPVSLQNKYRKFRGVITFDIPENSFIEPQFKSPAQVRNYVKRKHGWWKRRRVLDPRAEIRNVVLSGYFLPALEHANSISERSSCRFNLVFLDRRIIEFCLTAPAIEFVKDGVSRSFIRNSLHGYLPSAVANRDTKQLISYTDDTGMILNEELFWTIADKKDSLAWTIIDRKRMVTAYNDLKGGSVRCEDKPLLGHQLSKCINAAAFIQWFEGKQSSESCGG